MTPYWLLWSFFFLGVLLSRPQPGRLTTPYQETALSGGSSASDQIAMPLMAKAGLLVMSLMIGLRYKVGADWMAYEFIFKRAGLRTLEQNLTQSDPGFAFTNWLVQQAGGDLWVVNLVCGACTVSGIAALARREPQPWLCILLAIPYLIVVVAMGYTRQAAALGLVMVGFASLLRTQSVLRLVFWVALGSLFHKSAVLCLPMAAFTRTRGKAVDFLLLASAGFGLYTLLLQDSVDSLVKNYIGSRYNSGGAAIRVSMSALPAAIYLRFGRRFEFEDGERKLWRNMSYVALAAAIALPLSPSSTAVDRLALYLLPLQMIILGRVPGTLLTRSFGTVIVALYSGAVLFTWLNFATHSQYWVPYRSWIIR